MVDDSPVAFGQINPPDPELTNERLRGGTLRGVPKSIETMKKHVNDHETGKD
ncbi:hypothetical protein Pla175_29860 [Pirellulimonas nuda]|uniref:Uncharacterized protein n=1 Tax=Pirellulimonas nuda TaxID=2528009 RepID=A0A518DDM7_9BACT|nr:hypothetical protein [Pirellulimonas nuda]QDU89594.1 hypothetical protein Pla175_29860 [Pirellulimonas nuda]